MRLLICSSGLCLLLLCCCLANRLAGAVLLEPRQANGSNTRKSTIMASEAQDNDYDFIGEAISGLKQYFGLADADDTAVTPPAAASASAAAAVASSLASTDRHNKTAGGQAEGAQQAQGEDSLYTDLGAAVEYASEAAESLWQNFKKKLLNLMSGQTKPIATPTTTTTAAGSTATTTATTTKETTTETTTQETSTTTETTTQQTTTASPNAEGRALRKR